MTRLLAAIAAIALLAGCGSQSGTSTTTKTVTVEQAAQTQPPVTDDSLTSDDTQPVTASASKPKKHHEHTPRISPELVVNLMKPSDVTRFCALTSQYDAAYLFPFFKRGYGHHTPAEGYPTARSVYAELISRC